MKGKAAPKHEQGLPAVLRLVLQESEWNQSK